jgi:hypothetical protein
MSQHDFDIADQTASQARGDINNALQALASLSSLNTAPTTPYANMLWYDTGTNILKMRNEANSDWINVAYLDQGSSAFRILDDTQVMNTSGTQTGLLGDQATATWEAGSGTTESLVSPAKVKAAIEALSPGLSLQTLVNTTSGTSVDFDGIPSTAQEIYFHFLDFNSTVTHPNVPLVQLKVGGVAVTSGYYSVASNQSSTSGFNLYHPTNNRTGTMTIHKVASGVWVQTYQMAVTTPGISWGAGRVSGIGTVSGIRLWQNSGGFTSGQVSVSWR